MKYIAIIIGIFIGTVFFWKITGITECLPETGVMPLVGLWVEK